MIIYLGNKLSEHGFNPTSVETLGEKITGLNFQVITKSDFRNKFLRLFDMLYTIIKFHNHKPVILIDTYSTSAFWFAYLCAKLSFIYKLKYIPVLRGGDLPSRLDRSPNMSASLFKNSFANIAVSGYLQEEFSKRNIPVQTIHNYLEMENYPFTQRKEINPKILWVRSFHKIYNPEMALRVLQTVSKKYPFASLCMVGPEKDGSLEKCKDITKKLNLNVTYTGRLSKGEWIDLSKTFDVFINTTDVDNTPVSVMEAMALGMPVVTTKVGGISYLFEDGKEGLMVNKNDTDEMSDAIVSLINDPLKTTNISWSARNKAENWDWKIISKQWIQLLDDALKSR